MFASKIWINLFTSVFPPIFIWSWLPRSLLLDSGYEGFVLLVNGDEDYNNGDDDVVLNWCCPWCQYLLVAALRSPHRKRLSHSTAAVVLEDELLWPLSFSRPQPCPYWCIVLIVIFIVIGIPCCYLALPLSLGGARPSVGSHPPLVGSCGSMAVISLEASAGLLSSTVFFSVFMEALTAPPAG